MEVHPQDCEDWRLAPEIAQLPEQLVSQVLHHVGLHQRLGSCSLVCRGWRAAAGAATTRVSLEIESRTPSASSSSKRQALESWLCLHGTAVKGLAVKGNFSDRLPLQLPPAKLQRLQSLSIAYCSLLDQQHLHRLPDIPDTSSSSGSSSRQAWLSGLTSLTSLDLKAVYSSLAGLQMLTNLRQLRLEYVLPPKQLMQHQQQQVQEQEQEQEQEDTAARQQANDALLQLVAAALASLTQLTRLELCPLPENAPSAFSCLQQLQELNLGSAPVWRAQTLWGLPPSTTALSLLWTGCQESPDDNPQREVLSCSTVPALATLTAMQQLQLVSETHSPVRPDFLSSMQQLRALKISGKLSRDAMPALLAGLAVLSSLCSLQIIVSDGAVDALPASELSSYSALLPPSPRLTNLEISWDLDSPLLVPGCAQHMFAAGRRWPNLLHLVLGFPKDGFDMVFSADDSHHIADCVREMPAAFGLGDVSRLAECCPALQVLRIPGLVQPGVDFGALLDLSHLYCLFVGGEAVDDDVASGVLAEMTQLERLKVYAAPNLTDQGLLSLTALKGLTQLEAWGCGFSSSVSNEAEEEGCLKLYYEVSGVPNVWLQLLARCVRSDVCVEEATEQLLAYHADTEQRLAL